MHNWENSVNNLVSRLTCRLCPIYFDSINKNWFDKNKINQNIVKEIKIKIIKKASVLQVLLRLES
jgi:hypothetical protein